ncbi:hypothetical protein [Cellulomonas biazotea]|jgi:hypothetical protein|uniref:Uncharacterized protein n=1 Tax=Cellulomonas biazotea TaxID=1709 RepID=A0A402DRJ2_9CELL|nr:hypothetical protein [Cellulomonas biazotea]GCE76715.1 hypothetical protein CBZ_17710 [Cellulomonas biazotea]
MESDIAPHVRRALAAVEEARDLVRQARRVEWRSPTVARYLAALDDVDTRLRRSVHDVEHALGAAVAADDATTRARSGGSCATGFLL